MHLVYRANAKLEYVQSYPRSHLRMYCLAFFSAASSVTFGVTFELTSAGSSFATRLIEICCVFISAVYLLVIGLWSFWCISYVEVVFVRSFVRNGLFFWCLPERVVMELSSDSCKLLKSRLLGISTFLMPLRTNSVESLLPCYSTASNIWFFFLS